MLVSLDYGMDRYLINRSHCIVFCIVAIFARYTTHATQLQLLITNPE